MEILFFVYQVLMNTAYIHQLPLYKFTTSSAFRQHLCKKTLAVLGYVTPGKILGTATPKAIQK